MLDSWYEIISSFFCASAPCSPHRLFRELRRSFYALDEATGQLKWTFETAGEWRYAGRHLHGLLPAGETMPDSWAYFLSSRAVWNGGVYFGSGDGLVYALDTASGKLKWRFATADRVHSSPAISDGTLYRGS
jgi:outer membrane protein assembly factor BamB